MWKLLCAWVMGVGALYGEGLEWEGRPIEAVIFDCDGVLVDTEGLKFLAWQGALEEEGIPFVLEDYLPVVGHSSEKILQLIQEQKQREISGKVIAVKNGKYQALQRQGVPPLTPMIEFAKRLSQEKERLGIRLGLASSAPRREIMCNLEQVGLGDAFDCIVSGSDDLLDYEDAEGTNKPKPYIYMEAAKRLGVMPCRCVVFEDTAAGIEAAFGAGMIPVAVPNVFTERHDFSKATVVIESHDQLPFRESVER